MTLNVSPGQAQAYQELQQIATLNAGRMVLDQVPELREDGEDLTISLSISCLGETTSASAVPLQEWEPVVISIPARYPFVHPEVVVLHGRFAKLPHVIWGHRICLYLSPNDWDPGLGMRGLIGQLMLWFETVARGTILDGVIPWHAPLTYERTGESLIVRPDLPDAMENQSQIWLSLALIARRNERLYELLRWIDTSVNETNVGEFVAAWKRADASFSSPVFLTPVVALPEPVGFAYPRDLAELLASIEDQGLFRDRYDQMRRRAHSLNNIIWKLPAEWPEMILLGSPAPAAYAIRSRIAHIAAWRLGPRNAGVAWVSVYDQRPRITTRRDSGRAIGWLRRKRVRILGCGGLGAPVAEFCVRAGVDGVELIDNGVVHPGILVRQPFDYADIGRPKVEALADRLAAINPECQISGRIADAADVVADASGLSPVDLIVDATANRSVAVALERTRWAAAQLQPPLLSVMVGHDCARGASTLALSGATGAGVDLLRRLAVAASADDDLRDVLEDFVPSQPRTFVFQPEPGCSDPTYVGSASDLATFAGKMLTSATEILFAAKGSADIDYPRRWATVVRTGSRSATDRTLQWSDDLLLHDLVQAFQVRLERGALRSMLTETARMAAMRGPTVETGGILLGQIDTASKVIWITEAHGLPPGSQARTEAVALDPTIARLWAAQRRRATHGLVTFIGAWHTHPFSSAQPSERDLAAMKEMAQDGSPVLMAILGGGSQRFAQWLAGGPTPPIYTRVFFPG